MLENYWAFSNPSGHGILGVAAYPASAEAILLRPPVAYLLHLYATFGPSPHHRRIHTVSLRNHDVDLSSSGNCGSRYTGIARYRVSVSVSGHHGVMPLTSEVWVLRDRCDPLVEVRCSVGDERVAGAHCLLGALRVVAAGCSDVQAKRGLNFLWDQALLL